MDGWILLILAILPGVFSGDWGVFFQNQCAVRGTSIVIKCSFDYTFGNIVTSVVWYKSINGRLSYLSRLPSPPNVQYEGDKWSTCDLRINNVRTIDAGKYYFHFVTTLSRWTSKTAAQLSVTELSAAIERSTVTEGDVVRMTCTSGCPQTIPTVWFRDGQQVTGSEFVARIEDAGKYFCAVQGQWASSSNSVTLDVLYAPTNVKLAPSLKGDAVKGAPFTFTCSSNANPPVTDSGYSLYKDGMLVSSGPTHTITALQREDSGLYHCGAWNNVSRGGFDLMNSTGRNLDVLYGPEKLSVSLDPPQLVEGGGMNLTCSCEANPAVHNFTWYMRTASPDANSSSVLQVGSGQVMSLDSVEASHTGLYFCLARNSVGEAPSEEVLLALRTPRTGAEAPQVIGGIAVVVLLVLLILLLYWKTQRNKREQRQTVYDSGLTRKGPNCSEEPMDAIYANVQTTSSSHHRNANYVTTLSADEADLIYSAVSVKPKNRSRAPPKSRRKETKEEDSVLYSTVVIPR